MDSECQGKLFGISIGGKKSGVINSRARELLNRKDAIWTYPRENHAKTEKKENAVFEMTQEAGLEPPEAHTCLLLPKTEEEIQRREKAQYRAADLVLKMLKNGRDVLFLMDEDNTCQTAFKSLAGTLEQLDHSVQVEVIPQATAA